MQEVEGPGPAVRPLLTTNVHDRGWVAGGSASGRQEHDGESPKRPALGASIAPTKIPLSMKAIMGTFESLN